MSEQTFAKIDQTVLDTLRPATRVYWLTVALLAAGILGDWPAGSIRFLSVSVSVGKITR